MLVGSPSVRSIQVIWSAVLTKYSKTEVSYRLAAAGAKRRCGTCRMFQVANRDCAAVEGGIEANYVCNIWKLKVPPSSVNSIEQHD